MTSISVGHIILTPTKPVPRSETDKRFAEWTNKQKKLVTILSASPETHTAMTNHHQGNKLAGVLGATVIKLITEGNDRK